MNRETVEHDKIESSKSPLAESVWERWGQILSDWIPYVTLALSSVLSLFLPSETQTGNVGTIALVALAAAWVFALHTRCPQPRHVHQARMVLYFAGLLMFASALMSRRPIFFVFAITGFSHAADLKPWPLTVAGVAATSILINTIITGFPWRAPEAWIIFPTIIIIQILAIGFGMVQVEKLAERSEQRRQAVTRLEAALRENARLQAQLLKQSREAGILEERQRMAREIHDTLAQGLIGVITQLGAVQQAKNHPDDWQRHLANAMQLARESLAEARRSVNALRPEPLESARLPDALAEVAQHWSTLNGVPVEVTTTGDPIALHPGVEAALLRTAQEALANIAKHAHASRAGLTLSYMGDEVMLDVRDDGVGFTVTDQLVGNGAGFGLTSMWQRMSQVGGTLSIESEPEGGTAISARVPAIVAAQEISEE